MKTLALLLALLTAAPAMADPVMLFVFSNETLEFGPGDVVEAEQIIDPVVVQPVVQMQVSAAKGRSFGEMTRRHVGEAMKIIVCGRLVSEPRIMGPIPGGTGRLTGNFNKPEAVKLAAQLRTGVCAGV